MAVHELTSNGNAIAPSVVMQCRILVLLLLLPGSYMALDNSSHSYLTAIYAQTDIINSALQIILPQ